MTGYERNTGPSSSTHCLSFDTSKSLLNFDCHSLALNNQETRLLLVGNHELAFLNFETITSHIDNTINDDTNTVLPTLSDIKLVPLFDTNNINRPIVEWNHSDPNQYAVAIDRFVRLYTVDHSRINETNIIIDSQHQRPISTISYAPFDPTWFLTGALDGQIQLWDTRQSSAKTPSCLKLSVSTPFSIRRIQLASTKSDNANQLAVQCDRSIRIYDIRRPEPYLSLSNDLEHTQRIISMDWTKQTHSIATLSIDHSIRIFSTNGQILAESLTNEQTSYAFTKMRSTSADNLFICSSRDTMSSTYGFIGWRWDEDQFLRPLTDRIISSTPSSIVDFCFVTNTRFFNIFPNYSSSCLNDDSTHRFLLLTWCRDGRLYLVDMDSTFRQAWNNYHIRSSTRHLSDSSSSLSNSRSSSILSRHQQTSRRSSTMMTMDVIKDEATDSGETDEDEDEYDNAFHPTSESPLHTIESAEMSDENDNSNMSDPPKINPTEVSIDNELNSLRDSYGPYVIVESKQKERPICVVRCIYSIEHSLSFRIYLILSRHYPIISQLFIRFKLSTITNDERLKSFQTRIQKILEETSYNYFYHGQLCLHKCLLKLKYLVGLYHKEDKLCSALTTNNFNKKREQSSTNSELDSSNGLISSNTANNNTSTNNNNNNTNSNRAYGTSSSSTRTSDSQLSGISFAQIKRPTCGARFSGGTYLICFGQISNGQQLNSAPVLTMPNDGNINRSQPLPMRSTSLTIAKSRENSSTEERTTTATGTNAVQIQSIANNPQRLPMSSAPVRSLGTSVFNDHQRIPTSYRRSLGQLTHPHSTVSIYDVSILLPVSKKLADDYKIDLNNPLDMCEINQQLTERMGKDELVHCWRLLDGLLSLQPNLQNDDPWFQTPIAQGLIKHLVSIYIKNGDIQSASMFLLTMSQTPYLKTKIQSKLVNEHDHDPILYAYASLLHRWKHFYKRTQILSQIDHNCQSPAPFNQTSSITTMITCSICLRPVLGQHFLCAICGHGGHLTHMHDWFSSDELKHKFCPEKDCTCRCIIKQQELLTINTMHIQQQQHQQTPTLSTTRSYFGRQPSGNIRPL